MQKEDFLKSFETIKNYVTPSPIIKSEWLSKKLEAEVFLKLECLQPGNSFKIRGATNALLSDKLPQKVISASGGNHGLGVAIACYRLEVPCHIVLPTNTSAYRLDLLRKWGAEVELYGDAWDDANKYALKLAEDEDILYVHPFADEAVILGQGTIGLELLKQLDKIDVLVASVGGGGLLTGIALAMNFMNKKPEIVSVETIGADSFTQSFQKGEIIELDAITSIAKTLGARKTVPVIYNNLSKLVDHVLTVSDADAVKMMGEVLEKEKLLVEPACSCNFAAALQHKELFKGKTVVIIVCGSNVTLEEYLNWKEEFKV